MVKNFRIIIMGISKWLKQRAAMLSLAMAGVEKNSLGQKGHSLEQTINQERRHTQGTMLDSLKEGRVTQEVMDLRWRTYKILKASDGVTANIKGYDDNGQPIYSIKKLDKKKGLTKVKVDNFDNYPLELVVDNSPISSGGNDAMDNTFISIYDEAHKNLNADGEVVSVSHGEISSDDYFATNKADIPIKIGRMFIPKFEIERYTKKLNVRKINDTERLLEFYISMYPDLEDRKTRLLVSEIKKAISNPLSATFLEIKEVGFITYKTLGVDDFLEYQYDIKSLDKIIEYNGHYVIKFIASIKIDGRDILDEHRMADLDDKYEKKEKKKE
jgi:hypothetical protein